MLKFENGRANEETTCHRIATPFPLHLIARKDFYTDQHSQKIFGLHCINAKTHDENKAAASSPKPLTATTSSEKKEVKESPATPAGEK